jgi:hypothetical protein
MLGRVRIVLATCRIILLYMKEKGGNAGQPYQNIFVHIDSTCIIMHLTIIKIYLSHIEKSKYHSNMHP